MSVDEESLRRRLQDEYSLFADNPQDGEHGRRRALRLGYPAEWLDELPPWVVEPFAGTGNPFAWGPLPAGARVLDVGCGAGLDSILAAVQVGPEGFVLGADLTEEMVRWAVSTADSLQLTNAAFMPAIAERLPLVEGSFDFVLSNGMLLFSSDQEMALCEMHRVLRSGGRLLLSTIIVEHGISLAKRCDLDSWVECRSGALPLASLLRLLRQCGFSAVEYARTGDVCYTKVDETLDANRRRLGITLRAVKALMPRSAV